MRTKDLHDRYAQPIFNYCLRRLRSREEAEDAAQIVFLNAHRCLEEGVEPQSERAWLFKIAEHVVMYRRRTISRRARVEFPIDVDAIADLVVAPGRDLPPELHGLPEALARIPVAQARAIVLREWYGLSYREVAAELGLSSSAAETLIFRARRRLAQELGGPAPTERRRRPLGLASPLASLKWLLGTGVSLKALVGVTSVAVLAVGSTRVGLLQQPASAAAATVQQRVLALPAAPALRHALRLGAPVATGSPVRKAGAHAPHDPAPAASASVSTPVVAAADPAATVAAPDPAATPAPVQAASEDDRSQAAVETAPATVEEFPVAPDEAPAQPAVVDVAAGDPADTTASAPGQSGEPHGPNELAAAGQAERSDQVPATAAVPGSEGNAAWPQNGNALPQPQNEGAPDLSALPGVAKGPDSQLPAPATDPTAPPAPSGGEPPPQAQAVAVAATPPPQGNGPAGQDVRAAVAL